MFTDHESYHSDIIVCSMDYATFQINLLPLDYQDYSREYWFRKTIAPSAFLIYLRLNKKLKNLEHHNLYFNTKWEIHFDKVFYDKK